MYTFKPKKNYAKACNRNARISTKSATKICRVIRGKTLKRSKRLLNNLLHERQSLDGKYYNKTVEEVLSLLNSCEKNADFAGLEKSKLFVHASAHKGTIIRRRRRKAAYGSRLKSTNLEIMLIEKGSERLSKEEPKSKEEEKTESKEESEQKKKPVVSTLPKKKEPAEKKPADASSIPKGEKK